MKFEDIEWLYDYILRSSNSVLTTSVLASVATDYPKEVASASFPFLKVPKFYSLDLERSVQEMGKYEQNWFFAQMHRDPMSDIYTEERRTAALRPWRKESLENLLIRLQLFEDTREGAFEIIDDLGEKVEKTTEDSSLRFMLHRADTRHWKAVEDDENNRVIFKTDRELDQDLVEEQKSFNDNHKYDGDITKLKVWSSSVFVNEGEGRDSYSSHFEAFEVAKMLTEKLLNNEIGGYAEMLVGTLATTVAIMIRDHSAELKDEDVEWCIRWIVDAVTVHADEKESIAIHDATDAYGSAACASVIPILFDSAETEEEVLWVKEVIAIALTHENQNVQNHAAGGVRKYLWSRDASFAEQCLIGVVQYASFIQSNLRALRMHGYVQDDESNNSESEWLTLKNEFRQNLVNNELSHDMSDISCENTFRLVFAFAAVCYPV